MNVSNLDKSLDDIASQHRRKRAGPAGGRKQTHVRLNAVRSTPYQAQRQTSTNVVPTAPRGDSVGSWKHDLYKSVNINSAANGTKATNGKEEIVQFPPKRLSVQEKDHLLKENPLYQRLDAPPNKGSLFSPPTAPAAMKEPISTPNIPAQSISIAGTATAYVILSNLALSVSAEDVRATLSNIGGGVKEVHIISSTGQGIQVKVAFMRPEGGRECIAKFNGINADGRIISAAFEKPATKERDQQVSFLNRTAETITATPPKGPRWQKKAPASNHEPTEYEYIPKLYSDQLMSGGGQGRGARLGGL